VTALLEEIAATVGGLDRVADRGSPELSRKDGRGIG
jgi:hypothetical protein